MFDRLRKHLDYARFARRTKAIDATAPLACNPGAACEIHTMLGIRDVQMYLIAIKSLLRWYADVAVVVHSDGSLEPDTRRTLEHHVPGIRVIEAADADRYAAERLPEGSAIAKWRGVDAFYRRLIDTHLWSRTPKRVILDSDVLVVNEPKEFIRWVESGSKAFLLGQPADDDSFPTTPPDTTAHVQAHFRFAVPDIARMTGLAPRFLQGTTAGFHGYADEITLDRVERVITAATSLGLRITQWGGDQCVVIYLLSAAGADRLNEERCFNFDPSKVTACAEAEIIHFYGTHRFYQGIYPAQAAAVCAELLAR